MFLGIEIGGTKLQIGVGAGDGHLLDLWRGSVDSAAGGEGIRQQIAERVPALLSRTKPGTICGVGIGYGGPTDDATQSVIKSHHVTGWDGFPLVKWMEDLLGLPAVMCNDADVAGLGEALFGAGKGLSPIFYITVGTGVGGGLILDGEIYRGVGKGASEIGHLTLDAAGTIIEARAAGWGIEAIARKRLAGKYPEKTITGKFLAAEARAGNAEAAAIFQEAVNALGTGIAQMITLLCPRRVVIGGGISLSGDDLFFNPLRKVVAERTFAPFVGLTDIVPAALGEEVVVHGALALARKRFGP